MMNDKSDCLAALKSSLRRTAKWRARTIAPRFNDPRNQAAIALLKELVEQADLTDDEWSQLQPFFDWKSEHWTDAVSDASRKVGFVSGITDFSSYLGALHGLLVA